MLKTNSMDREMQIVSFYIGDSLYGLDIRYVKEVHAFSGVTNVPLNLPHISGLVNIRGQIVLVIDTPIIFGDGQTQPGSDTHLIIFKTAQELEKNRMITPGTDWYKLMDKPIALLVDRIGDILTVPAANIEDPPQHMDETRAKFVRYVVKTDTFFLIVLDPERLIAGETIIDKNRISQFV
jgi:purine-binding chemotaxis protein CheW